MAQLNATVNDIELITNRLGSKTDLTQMATWDDEKYPTTALLRNVANDLNSRIVTSGTGGAAAAYPIGSVIMTVTDVNPGQVTYNGPLPGKWEPVDRAFKMFKDGNDLNYFVNGTDWTKGTTGIADLITGSMIRDGHMISLHLELKLTRELSSPTPSSSTGVTLGSLNRASCGITTNGGKFYPFFANHQLAYAYHSGTEASFVICYTLSNDGGIYVQDILSSKNNNNTLTMPSGTEIIIDTITTTRYDHMMSAACDRFYWKRTA